MTNENDLKPCPFCRCDPDGYEGRQVSCRCGAMGPIETQGDPESPAWNTRALPAAPMGATAGEVERIVWRAMIWAASNDARFVGATEYTDSGNSFAEEEARAAARRILAALTPQPAPTLADALELPEIRALVENATRLVDDVDDLIAHSEGVAGLSTNGNLAPWDTITEGGEFEEWLKSLQWLRAALAALQTEGGA